MILFRCACAILLLGVPCMAQHPLTIDVSTVVVGAERLETLWTFTMGKWSDAGDHVGLNSTEIHCYQRFGFCEVADASVISGLASVNLTSFDILRWDASELIAVDSSPICVVNNLRFDFVAKKVSLSSALKGETRDKYCSGLTPSMTATAFLTDGRGETGSKKE